MQADTKHKSGTAHLRNIILVAFALSGMSSLIYEVVWARQLQLVFGSTVYAVSTLLAGFMAGFALGAYLFKDIADKSNNPWKIFSFLEIGIGLYALLAIPLVKFMPHLYLFMLGVPGFTAMQFIIAFAFVLIPATLFGATFMSLLHYIQEKNILEGILEGFIHLIPLVVQLGLYLPGLC